MAKRRANGEGSLRKRKDGRWEGRYTAGTDPVTGKAIVKNVLGKTQAEVKEKLKKAIAESENLDIKRSGMYTVGEWMDLWYEVYAKPRIRESTSVYYRMFIDTHIRPKLGDIKLNQLQTMDIQRLYNELRENGRIRKEIKDKQPGLSVSYIRGMGGGAGIGDAIKSCKTEELMEGCVEKLDVFSHHYYNGISERMAAMVPSAYVLAEGAMSEDYLGMASHCARAFSKFRDMYVPGGEMWVTESGDAGASGHTWASTYLEVPRTLNELADFVTVTNGVIFHNTLASSDYGWLKHGSFLPRPSYFAVLLWKKLMGNTVYDSGEARRESAHVYAHSRADGKDGVVYLIINNSWTETTTVELPKEAEVYALTGNGKMRSRTIYCFGLGVPRDLDKGMEWLRVSASHGNQHAASLLRHVQEHIHVATVRGVFGLLQSIAKMIQEDGDHLYQKRIGIDRKQRQKIIEKKMAQGKRHQAEYENYRGIDMQ